MAAVVGAVEAALRLDGTGWQPALDKAGGQLSAWEGKSLKSISHVEGGFGGLVVRMRELGERGLDRGVAGLTDQFGELARAVVLPLAGLATLGGALEAVKGQIERADQAGKLAASLGLSVEALTQLQHAAQMTDTPLDTLSTGLRALDKNALSFATGTKSGPAKAFSQLGVSVTDASGKLKPANELLSDVADRFSHMQNSAEKTALAQELFGRSGAALIPLLNEGREGLKRLADESDRLGLTISGKAAAGAAALADKVKLLGDRLQGVVSTVVQDTIPAIEGAVDSIADLLDKAGGTGAVVSLLEGGVRDVSSFIVQMSGAVEELTDDIIGLQDAWTVLTTGKGGAWAFEAWFKQGSDAAAAADAKAKSILAGTFVPPSSGEPTGGAAVGDDDPLGTGSATPRVKAQTAAIDEMKKSLEEVTRAAEDFASTFTGDLLDGKSLTDSLSDALGNLGKQLIQMATNAAIESLFSSLLDVYGPTKVIPGAGALANWAPSLFAGGGAVFGSGSATSDSVPARLSSGEFVVNARSTSMFRPLLESMNSRRFAAGGFNGVSKVMGSMTGGINLGDVNVYAPGASKDDANAIAGAVADRVLRQINQAFPSAVQHVNRHPREKNKTYFGTPA